LLQETGMTSRTISLILASALLVTLPGIASAAPPAFLKKVVRPFLPQKAPMNITWQPQAKDWSFVDRVKAFQANIPSNVARKLQQATPKQLADAFSVTYTQKVDDGRGQGPKRAAVHITQGLVNAPLDKFLSKLPAENWGPSLDHYLGGQIKVYDRDATGRPTRQVERMVLSGLPGNLNIRGVNLDMCKVEQKEITRDAAGNVSKVTMYWRVHDSANKTTAMDVGSVSFQASGNQTLVVFHSAHRLRLNPIPLPSLIVRPTLKSFFSDHVRNYRDIVTPPRPVE
jgi:hypothetical protein